MSKTLRYGIIGCGSMGREHIENIKALGGAQVTALADPHADSREAALALLQDAAQAPQVFASHHDLLSSGLCDAVVIATPNFTHIEMMRAALATDLHILVEKPLVTRIEDGVEMMALAKDRQSLVWVAQEYRFMPPVAEMIRLAHQGEVGRLHQVSIREHREPFYPKVGDWNRFSANTGGTLVEKCCHYFNLMDLILREKPQRVFASGGPVPTIWTSPMVGTGPTSWTAPSSSSSTPAVRAPCWTCACLLKTRSTANKSSSSATKASWNPCCPR